MTFQFFFRQVGFWGRAGGTNSVCVSDQYGSSLFLNCLHEIKLVYPPQEIYLYMSKGPFDSIRLDIHTFVRNEARIDPKKYDFRWKGPTFRAQTYTRKLKFPSYFCKKISRLDIHTSIRNEARINQKITFFAKKNF